MHCLELAELNGDDFSTVCSDVYTVYHFINH